MGLISTLLSSTSSALRDQWREYFYCDSLPMDVIIRKGQKRTNGSASTRSGSDNIITNGSIVAVNEGQFMIIVDQGKVVEFTDQTGEFLYDTSKEPTLFYGSFGKNLLETFKLIGKRITFGGETARDQRIYYFNKKELMGNKYGTPNPIPFRFVDNKIGLDMDGSIRCFGEYSYKLVDPLLFYANVAGNISNEFNRSEIDSQLKSELLSALQPTFARIGAMGVRYSELMAHTEEISQTLNEVLSSKWSQGRGIAVSNFGISSITAPEDVEKTIKELQRRAVYKDPGMAAAALADAQAEAMVAAAKNEKAGAMFGFAGMGMAQNAGGMNAASLYQVAAQQNMAQPQMQAAPAAGSWVCECGQENTGKFCTNCGKTKPEEKPGWTCECGHVNQGKFCSNCGKKKPAGAPLYRCDKCGWQPEDPTKPPRFCPECGDVFDDSDIQ